MIIACRQNNVIFKFPGLVSVKFFSEIKGFTFKANFRGLAAPPPEISLDMWKHVFVKGAQQVPPPKKAQQVPHDSEITCKMRKSHHRSKSPTQ